MNAGPKSASKRAEIEHGDPTVLLVEGELRRLGWVGVGVGSDRAAERVTCAT
jgi:hypothetical protein